MDVYLENDWEESEKIGLRDLKRLGRGAREGGSDVGNLGLRHIQLQTITSPAGDPDFDNTGGTMPLIRSSDVNSSAFPKSSASSTVKPNPTPVL